MEKITLNAPTKINLRLKVLGKRPDGYHILSMLNEKLTLSDTLDLEMTGPIVKYNGDTKVELFCADNPSLATDSNLIVKAVRKFSQAAGVTSPLKISLTKRIPIGAGLGGGSSDAGTTLMALNRLWGTNKPKEELARIGVTIGADVPFFVWAGPAHVTGIGEGVNPNITLPKLWVLLVNPGFEVSTKWVYNSLGFKLTENVQDDSFPAVFKDLAGLKPYVENDLEGVVLKKHGEVKEIKDFLSREKAFVVFMSGSGPTVVGIFMSREERDSALVAVRCKSWKCFPTEN